MPLLEAHRGSAGRCTVCAARSGAVVDHRNGFDLVQCACGAMFLVPEPSGDAVDPTVDPHPDSFYALPAEMKVRWLLRSRSRGTLVEAGCGRGHFLSAAQRAGFAVGGIEADAHRAAALAARLRVHIEAARLEESSWPDASCDVVCHCDLLSHFHHPADALLRMRRLLRPRGVMFFEVGLVGGLARHWYRRMPDHTLPRHRWFFDSASLRRLLADTGFAIRRIRTFGLGPQVLMYGAARRAKNMVRRVTGGHRTEPASPLVDPARERWCEGRCNNWLRFGLGRWAPGFGPETALVLATTEGAP